LPELLSRKRLEQEWLPINLQGQGEGQAVTRIVFQRAATMKTLMDRARRHLIGSVLVATIAALAASPAVAQSQKQIDACKNKDNAFTPDVRIDACSALIQSGGNSVATYRRLRCRAYSDKGDYDRALADCNEAIRLDAKSAAAFNDRGIVYQRKSDLDRAIADFTEAIRLDPKLSDAFNNRGNAYADKNDRDRAIADFDEAVRLDPKDAIAYRNRGLTYKDNRGLTYKEKGDLDHAIADYTAAIRVDPKYGDAYNSRCWARALAGRDCPRRWPTATRRCGLIPARPTTSTAAVSCS
jgi:tetratricopeptide (TPR) repeat protein